MHLAGLHRTSPVSSRVRYTKILGLFFSILSLEISAQSTVLPKNKPVLVNGNYAISAGIWSTAIHREILIPEHINLVAVRTDDLDKRFVKDIKAVVESDEFLKVVDDPRNIFKDFQKPDWLKAKVK